MTYIPLTGASSGGSKPSNWTVRERLRNITKALTAGSSLDLRFAEKFFYQQDSLYPAMELMATHSRTSSAWYPNWDFKSGSEVGRLVEYGANERRYGDYGALDEAASTNHIRNPRCEGASAPSTYPTNWSIAVAGNSHEAIGSGTENGAPYVDVRLNGTPTTDPQLRFETTGGVAALDAQTWTLSVGIKVVGGDQTNINGIKLIGIERAAGAFVTQSVGSLESMDASHRRFFHTFTLSGGGTVDALQPGIVIDWDGSGAIDITLRIYAPQLEQAATPTSPILPTAGTPAAATRAADVVTGVTTDRASRGWYDTQWDYTNGGVCGDLLEFLPGVPRVGPQGLLVEEGTTNHIRNPRGEGAVAGSPGTFPTNWGTVLNGTTMNVQGSGTEDGWRYVDIEVTGTAAGSFSINLEDAGVVAAVNGQDWTQSVGLRLMSGDFTNAGAPRLVLRQRTGALGSLGEFAEDVSIDGLHRRFFLSTVTNDPSVGFVQPTLKWAGAGGAVQFVIRIYAPQLEQKAYPTSVVLPEAGSPGAATRAAEDSFEIDDGPHTNAGGAFSALIEGAAPSVLTLWPSLMGVGADNANQALFTKNASGNDDWYASLMAAGVQQLTYSSGPNGADSGVPIRFAVRCAENDVFYARNIGGLTDSQADTSASVNHLTAHKVSLGSGVGNPARGCMFITAFRYWPLGLADSQLEALVA